jgi:signal transduction histidine kinase
VAAIKPTNAENASTFAPITFETAEVVFSSSETIPTSGWREQQMPVQDLFEAETSASRERKTAWVRFEFDAAQLGPAPLALTINATSERFISFINGQEIYRNFIEPTDRNFASFQPYLIPIDARSLKAGKNSLVLRLESEIFWTVLINGVALGSDQAVRPNYETHYFMQFQGPQLVNAILGTMTVLVFMFWLVRPNEVVFGWLAAVGLCWFARNIHYSLLRAPIDPKWIWEIALNATFLLLFTFTGFGTNFYNLKNKTKIMRFTLAFTALVICSRYLLLHFEQSDLASNLATVPASIGISYIYAKESWRNPTAENIIMLATVILAFGFAYHDFALLAGLETGFDFQIMPYASLIVFFAFSFALGRRLLGAFSLEENMTSILALRVDAATNKLAASEGARRNLEVLNAVTLERDRMMREIHDGIGSSLVTALAVAERQNADTNAIGALKNALVELRVAVDSLEPFGGDLATLLASLRYRIEPDLNKAGLTFDWQVDSVPELEWLDAVNALHIMRLFQQAVSNIVEHANASKITVSCASEFLEGKSGIRIQIKDNGSGFVYNEDKIGHGLNNMQARAEALHANLKVESALNRGTLISLWLPQQRSSVAGSSTPTQH